MKICNSWLQEWIEHGLEPVRLGECLTMLGLEVESLAEVGYASEGLVAGLVRSTHPHPRADRLTLCMVDIGAAAPINIVCGARNVRPGGIYVTALPGARLPGGLEISSTTIRGETSGGMLCSASELGISDISEGLIELDADTPAGADANALLRLGDHVFDINVTPNRADCFSVSGIARDLSAFIGANLRNPRHARLAATIGDRLPLSVESAADCPRLAGRLIRGINPQARTPLWMSERLRRCGIRPLYPVVDVVNYVMLELGQPMHAYDLDLLGKSGIRVRRARPAESLALLDGQEARLDADMLVIADDRGPIGIAGVMGGQSTAVSAATRNVFLESAFFAPSVIAGRARRLGLHTDASLRFERGVNATGQSRALDRAASLILQIAGGEAGPIDEILSEEHLPVRKPVRLRASRLAKVLGTEVPAEEVCTILNRLDMRVETCGADWTVVPPPARFDLEREEDLIEEVARVFGYERIPEVAAVCESRLPAAGEEPDPLTVLRTGLIARGYQEAITYSFISPDLGRRFGARDAPQLTLSNPISADMAVMRQSLWPGLITVASTNLHRQQDRLRLFEIGSRFRMSGDGVVEEICVAGVIVGDRLPEQWGSRSERSDVFDLKCDVEAILGLFGRADDAHFGTGSHPALHPGRSASIELDQQAIGWVGEIHPALAADLEISNAVLFEIPVGTLRRQRQSACSPVSRFPVVRRDLAVVVSREVRAEALLNVVRRSAPTTLRDAFIFDIYTGPQIADSEKSVAIGLILQDTSRTLREEEADDALQQLRAALADELQARYRE